MRILIPLFAIVAFIVIAFVGARGLFGQLAFGVVLPYLCIATFISGVIYRIIIWGKTPVPFRIPTTCGQQKSLPWIKQSKIENPTSTGWLIVRMLLEVFLFRSLFRNTKTQFHRNGPKVAYAEEKWLWLAGILFHYSFLVIFIRHFRLLLDPIPGFVTILNNVDGFLQIGSPGLYITDILLLAAVTFLLIRRFILPQVRYISLANDYFPLFLIMGIGGTGVLLRFFFRGEETKNLVDSVKVLATSLTRFDLGTLTTYDLGIGWFFYLHLFLVCILIAYFPFSKLMHMGGIFMSPTRNMLSNNRMVRHVNPWDYPVKLHTYAEYEDEFREEMKGLGIPVEKE